MDVVGHIAFFFILLTWMGYQVQSLKVMVVPMNMGSHLLYMGQVGAALAEEGHQVVMYIPSNNKRPQGLSPKVRDVTYNSPYEVPFGNSDEMARIEIQAVLTESTMEWMSLMEEMQVVFIEALNKECESLQGLYEEIKAEKYDLALMDGAGFTCFYTIPYKLGIPYITISVPFMMWMFRIPHLSSQWPSIMTNYNETMNFWQRLSAFGIDLMDIYFANDTEIHCKRFVPERKPKGDSTLLMESAMWWHLYDLSVGYPKPSMPNLLEMGDVMARSAQPLPEEYVDIMNASAEKVILMSLGSHFDHVPEAWLQKLCEAFNSVKYTIIWKLKVKLPCHTKQNVHIKKWVPQNDLLAHPKLAMFITHCGLNSVIESVSHGKPMVGLPITIDQPYNAKVIETKGYGKTLNLKTFTPQELVETINDVTENEIYSENTRKGSEIMFNKVTTPAQRMSFWAEHIVKYGDSHLRTKAHDLSLFEFLMVDIFLFLFCVALVCLIVLLGICLGCLKCCRRFVCKNTEKVKTQ